MYSLDAYDWIQILIGALLIGFAKTSIGGFGGLAVAIFAGVLPSRESTGLILPLLICADIVAVASYQKHVVWRHILRITPWTLGGVILGYWIMEHLNDNEVRKSIGCILLILTFIHILRQNKKSPLADIEKNNLSFSAIVFLGIFIGATTMIANAAGAVFAIYMLSLRMPKLEFLGTSAWFFFLLNSIKVPFSYHLGLIHPESLQLNLLLIPAVLLGAWGGRILIRWINQKLFERLALGFTILAGIRLLM